MAIIKYSPFKNKTRPSANDLILSNLQKRPTLKINATQLETTRVWNIYTAVAPYTVPILLYPPTTKFAAIQWRRNCILHRAPESHTRSYALSLKKQYTYIQSQNRHSIHHIAIQRCTYQHGKEREISLLVCPDYVSDIGSIHSK